MTKKILAGILIAISYIGITFFIRLSPIMIAFREAFRERNGFGLVLLFYFLFFAVSMILSGLLKPHYDAPKNRRERIGEFLLQTAHLSRFILIALFPLLLALAIK